jgi:hypothetical protein
MRRLARTCGVQATLALLALASAVAGAQSQSWLTQFGGDKYEEVAGCVFAPQGGALAAGTTLSALAGANAGYQDVWVARWDAAGSPLWIVQFGSSLSDSARWALEDSAGGVRVGGQTYSALFGPSSGGGDIWLAGLDSNGALAWTRQMGTSALDECHAAAHASAGGFFAVGVTQGLLGPQGAGGTDAWLGRFDAGGQTQWIHQFGSNDSDRAVCAASDGAGGVLVAGATHGSLGGTNAGSWDAWLTRFDGQANELWSVQLGSATLDEALAVASDGLGGAFLAGVTDGDLAAVNAGGRDVWIARFDALGNQVWMVQLGSTAFEEVRALSADGAGGLYAGGTTLGDLLGPGSGELDIWLQRRDAAGSVSWQQQWGTASSDVAIAASGGAPGEWLVGGTTAGDLGGPGAGQWDAWLARYEIPCSVASYCTPKLSSNGCVPSMLGSGVPSLSNPWAFSLLALNLEENQSGLVFFGTSGPLDVPFQGGTLCVSPPLYRLNVQNTAGAGACTGALVYGLADLLAQPSGGALVQATYPVHLQCWFRDPPAASSTGLSDALELWPCP